MSEIVTVNRKRLCREFAELTGIDSPSFGERRMADALTEKLREIGFEVWEDDAFAGETGGAGNLYGFLAGTVPGPPVLLSAHMDTVEPSKGKKAFFDGDGRITGTGEAVLGADDVTGIVEILEGIRSVREAGLPHRDLEVVFCAAEESYGKGSARMDFGKLRAKEAYVLDLTGEVGTAARKAPSIITFRAVVEGKASHAGFAPEKGIHAIRIMSEAVSRLKQGHLDGDTTLNVGCIQGGTATNIVPERCVCTGEVRSYDHGKALRCIQEAEAVFAGAAESAGACFHMETEVHMKAYEIPETDPAVQRFVSACGRLGIRSELTATFGGSDNNVFVQHGIRGLVLSSGMYQVHSTQEYSRVQDLEMGARLVAELIRKK